MPGSRAPLRGGAEADFHGAQDIINIYSYKYIKEFLKCVINILLKYTGAVFYTKWYY